jgi:GT2 family glycosyltransferase
MNLSIIIPVYKNKEQFLTFLKHNLQFLEGCEVIIVNDYPEESLKNNLDNLFKTIEIDKGTGGTREGSPLARTQEHLWGGYRVTGSETMPSLENNFRITLLENEKNLGFGPTVNRGVEHAKNPYVMLLNTDVKLLDSSFQKELTYFQENKNLFAVSFAQKEKNGELEGKKRMYWQNGFFNHSHGTNFTFGMSAWAEGGSCIIDRTRFLDLGGFDKLYSPFYWEDIDLSYKAWKKGYEVFFDPSILVEHHHESTIGKYFMPDRIRFITLRNQFIFIWKNITDSNLIWQHIWLLPKHILYYCLRGDFLFLKAFIAALSMLPSILESRGKTPQNKTDEEILGYFK